MKCLTSQSTKNLSETILILKTSILVTKVNIFWSSVRVKSIEILKTISQAKTIAFDL